MLIVLSFIIGILVAGAIALQFAIQTNGAAVLNAVDRLTGGTQATTRSEGIEYGPADAQKLFVIRQNVTVDSEPLPVIIFIHGGSWRDGDPHDYDFIGRSLAPHGFLVVNLGYRLDAFGRWPAMLEDSASGVAWVRDNIAEYGGDPDRILIMGHSAGAYNAAMLALDRQWLDNVNVPTGTIKGFVGLAGPYDFYPFDTDSTRAAFGHAPDPGQTQPINHVRSDAPPMLLVHGLGDTTVKPRNSRALHKMISAAGGDVMLLEYAGMDHSDPLISLAAPWRNRREIHARLVEFARRTTSSVPVQAETR